VPTCNKFYIADVLFCTGGDGRVVCVGGVQELDTVATEDEKKRGTGAGGRCVQKRNVYRRGVCTGDARVLERGVYKERDECEESKQAREIERKTAKLPLAALHNASPTVCALHQPRASPDPRSIEIVLSLPPPFLFFSAFFVFSYSTLFWLF
jgi:hypothetical protein